MKNEQSRCIGYCEIEDGAFVEIYYEGDRIAIVAREFFYRNSVRICTNTYEEVFGYRRDRW